LGKQNFQKKFAGVVLTSVYSVVKKTEKGVGVEQKNGPGPDQDQPISTM